MQIGTPNAKWEAVEGGVGGGGGDRAPVLLHPPSALSNTFADRKVGAFGKLHSSAGGSRDEGSVDDL